MTTTGSTSVGCDLFSQHYRPQPAYNTAILIISRLKAFRIKLLSQPVNMTLYFMPRAPARIEGLAEIKQLKRNYFLLRLLFAHRFTGR